MELINKMIRLERSTVDKVENLKKDISKKEYISFNALIRKLIIIGLDNWR